MSSEQAAAITTKALERLERLEAAVAADSGAPLVHRLHGEVRFGLEHALELDPEHAPAKAGLEKLEATLRVPTWEALARPLGILLLAAGLLGGSAAIANGVIRRSAPESATPLVRFSIWATVLVVVTVLGLIQLRKVDEVDKLVSTQTLGVWGFVALAGGLTQIVGYMLGLGPYALIPVTSLLIGIGIATLALQTRPWLLAPALVFFVGSLALAALPAYSREVLGTLLIVALGGIGLGLVLGAPLQPRDA